MKILAIETSCDDTGIAILQAPNKKLGDFHVLANIVASQIKIHQKYGGVFPMMAKREHQKNIVPTFLEALKKAELLKKINYKSQTTNHKQILNSKLEVLNSILEREPELAKKIIPFLKKYSKPNIDFVSVTNGPGLEPCLWVGVNFARAISYFWDIPLIPVNHIEGHILVNYLENKKIEFPAISLIVSGGHTQIVLIEDVGKYKILGETRDDACGECFDKAAKILGLGYPGGPIISALAKKFQITNLKSQANPDFQIPKLPRPMINTKDYDMSFSGLKTAILYSHQKQSKKIQKNKDYISAICAEIQQAIIDVLLKKTFKAVKDFNAKTIILGGGVSANSELRRQFNLQATTYNLQAIFPKPALSTDNGLMIAIAGYYNKNKAINPSTSSGRFPAKIEADSNLRIGE